MKTIGFLCLLVALVGCGHAERAPGEPPPAAPATAAPAPAAEAAPPSAATAAGGPLHWTRPADWVEETPSTPTRLAQYRVSGSGGDAECQVFHFGSGQGGDAQSNADRWKSQFTKP